MRGRKPNITPHPAAGRALSTPEKAALVPEDMAAHAREQLRPEELQVWDRVAPELASVDRLKPLYLDAVLEYCRVVTRLQESRQYLDEAEWTYIVEGRNGKQIKMRPQVAQVNEWWRHWRSLVGELGLSPASVRDLNMKQRSFFEDEWDQV